MISILRLFAGRALRSAMCLAMCAMAFTACDCEVNVNKRPSTTLPFANVKEADIVGKYKWFEDGNELGVAVLEADHSVTSWKGEKKPGYKWELQKEGLLIVWLRGFNFFPQVIKPGVYEGPKDSKMVRMEKK